jgi:hypothetical protein
LTAVIVLLVLVLAVIWRDGLAYWRHAQRPPTPAPRRPAPAQVWRIASLQVAAVIALFVLYLRGDWNSASVGFVATNSVLDVLYTILAGEIGFMAVVLSHLAAFALIGRLNVMRQLAARINLALWPRRPRERWVFAVAVMIVNPVTEELILRGVLVYQWGLLLGSPVVPILVAFVLNALLHAYQGWRMQVWHALFFCVAVTLLYSPWGLAAAITAHVFGDVMPFLHMRRNLQKVRAHARVQRARLRENSHPA